MYMFIFKCIGICIYRYIYTFIHSYINIQRETAKHEEGQGDGGGAESWAVSYHLIVLLERLYVHLPAAADHAVSYVYIYVYDDNVYLL
jgi:hypothetical protein